MSISFGALGTYVSSASDPITVPMPSGQDVNSRTFLVVATRTLYGSGAANPADPEGWTRLARMDGGSWPFTPASAPDVGISQVTVWYRDGECPSATVTFVVPGTVGIVHGIAVRYQKSNSAAIWNCKPSYGVDSTAGANISTADTFVNFGAESPDTIVALGAFATDGGSVSSAAIAAAGLTLSSTTVRSNTSTTTGHDGRLIVADCTVSSGTQTAPASYSHTNAATDQGSVVFIRITETPPPVVTITTGADFYANPYFQLLITGLSPFTHYEVKRRDSLGEYEDEYVRGGNRQMTQSSGVTLVDYEFHFSSQLAGDREIFYDVYLYNNDALQKKLSYNAGSPHQKRKLAGIHAGLAKAQLPVTYISDTAGGQIAVMIEDFSEYSNTGTILGSKRVLGRRNPVVRSDVLEGMTGSFVLLVAKFGTSGNTAATISGASNTLWSPQQLIEFFKNGSTYYIKHLWNRTTGIPDFYFKVSSISSKRQNRIAYQLGDDDTGYEAVMQVTVEWVEVDRPEPDSSPPLFTWGDVNTANDSWAAVRGGVLRPNQSWLDVLSDGA